MLIKHISLKNFRNYRQGELALTAGKTILIGENAQGKSNFLEAIELLSYGRSTRAGQDQELVMWGEKDLALKIEFEKMQALESVGYRLQMNAGSLQKQLFVNELPVSSTRKMLGRLITVSFKAYDLNLLRSGPKFRRDWLDSVILRVKPAYHDILLRYSRVLLQRNRLLKSWFEKGKVTVEDQDQLLSWDKQAAHFGAQIIKQRINMMTSLLPVANLHHRQISGNKESLSSGYLLSSNIDDQEDEDVQKGNHGFIGLAELDAEPTASLENRLLSSLKARRKEEIGRRQTVVGPHRDDLNFLLNEVDAVSYASQGQQRSLVLALKLAELAVISETIDEPPVLLLDDVLAELDPARQGFLMGAIPNNMQTVITTTHVSSFQPEWLSGATIINIAGGRICMPEEIPL